MSRKYLYFALCALALVSLLAACGQTEEATPDVMERHPFSLNIAGGEGAEVSWEAIRTGIAPAQQKPCLS